MSPPWSRPLEVDRLADSGADLDFAVPLAELPGLRPERPHVGGEVTGHAHFSRERGFTVVALELAGAARLECQRCLRPLEFPLRGQVRVALIDAADQATQVPEDLEPVLAPGGRISLAELITEELLLSLPIVPLHAGEGECRAADEPPAKTETHRPFAQLAELLKK
ncbi:MAG TPA: YceD family protein [Steroidobacteraceae bacterium]|nr:YceD family protein [Steroidobacteraceae bacterium]